MKVIYEVVTRGGAVIPSEPEEVADIASASKEATKWMAQKGEMIQFVTVDGGGASIRVNDIEHITVTPEDVWWRRQPPEYVEAVRGVSECTCSQPGLSLCPEHASLA